MEKPNLVLIVIDSLRLDFSENLYSRLDARGFVNYDKAIAPSNWTMPSHASMFTGLYPSMHGVHETRDLMVPDVKFDPRNDNVIDFAKGEGYNFYCFTANPAFTEYKRFPKGKHHFFYRASRNKPLNLSKEERKYYRNALMDKLAFGKVKKMFFDLKWKLLIKYLLNLGYVKIKETLEGWPFKKGAEIILKDLKKVKFEEPFFVFMNLIEVHEPYRGINLDKKQEDIVREDGKWDEKTLQKLRNEYVKEVEYISGITREMVEFLNEDYPNTLFIVTSDHGNILGETPHPYHRYGLEQELLLVPLMLRHPKGSIPADDGWVSLKDLNSLLRETIEGTPPEEINIYSPFVFSEGFGHRGPRHLMSDTEKTKKLLKEMNHHRVAMFWKDSMSVYNVDTEDLERVEMVDKGVRPKEEKLLSKFKSFVENAIGQV